MFSFENRTKGRRCYSAAASAEPPKRLRNFSWRPAMRTTVAALFLWAHLGCAVQPAVGDSGEMDRRKAYNALGIEEGSSADDALDSFVDLVILQRSLEADLSDEDFSAVYRELKDALLTVITGPNGARSCPSNLGGSGSVGDRGSLEAPSAKKERKGKQNPKVTVTIPEVMDERVLSQAIQELGMGRLENAKVLLDAYLKESPQDLGGLLTRGTALALGGELQEARKDFDSAVHLYPNVAEAYKRRSQTLSALGDTDGALEDLETAEKLQPPGATDRPEKSYIAQSKGMLHHKAGDHISCEQQFRMVTRMEPENAVAWNMLGLCMASQGKIEESLNHYEMCLSLKPDFREVFTNYADALKETGNLTRLEALVRMPALQEQKDTLAVRAFIHLTESHQVAGNHAYCVKLMDGYNPMECGSMTVWCLFLRGHCLQALGQYREAIADYQMALQQPPSSMLDQDVMTMQVLSFYMKEISVYYAHHADDSVGSFNMDSDLSPQLKESWTRRMSPTEDFVASYQPQPPLTPIDIAPLWSPDKAQLEALLAAAGTLGPLIHYRQSGFAANRRTQRMAGLAILEAAQAAQAAVAGFRSGEHVKVHNAGSSAAFESRGGEHPFGWRDLFDIIVKWRQLTEPNDAVLWVDRMTDAGFMEGFGAHTPIVIGQFMSRRYSSNLQRGILLFKEEISAAGGFYNAENEWVALGDNKIAQLARAKDLKEIYRVMGESGWATIKINSTQAAHLQLEATRLTLLRRPGKADSFDFSIRTPVTPHRFKLFQTEMDTQWERLLQAGTAGDKPAAAQIILTIGYLWYNLMALARGTAAVGYVAILSLFLALDMPVTESAPKGFQLDWKAIFSKDTAEFNEAVGAWLLPTVARPGGGADAESSSGDSSSGICAAGGERGRCGPSDIQLEELPRVSEVLPSVRFRVELLNDAVAERLSQV